MDTEKISKFIATARTKTGFTQKELADKIGVSDKTISKWETGKSLPDIFYYEALCDALNIKVNELLSGEYLTEDVYLEKAETNFVDIIPEKSVVNINLQKIDNDAGIYLKSRAINLVSDEINFDILKKKR